MKPFRKVNLRLYHHYLFNMSILPTGNDNGSLAEVLEQQLAYWKQQLAGLSSITRITD
jgi:hypothetical protein